MSCNLNLDQNYGWLHTHNAIIRGAAFAGNNLLQGDSLAKHFDDVVSPLDFSSAIKQLNGFYGIVLQKGDLLMAAVDRVRSIPLFYAYTRDKLYLSDNAEWVRLQIGSKQRERMAETEFILTGYVTGEDTLYPGVKQLQAGEMLIAHVDGSEVIVRKNRYYRYLHSEERQVDKENLADALDRVLVNCMQRLIRYANGRMIVVPLSSGYDSRLIATALKRLGYDHIFAFSYGRPGNKESEISKWVAECLDIPWHFVPYSSKVWREWFYSEERKAYYFLAHNLVSLPIFTNLPAVKTLKHEGVIGPDSVFVPGHTGDFIAGGHIPENFFSNSQIGENLYLGAVIKKHYSLWPFDDVDDAVRDELKCRILQTTEAIDLLSPAGAADAIEKWDWQERQAKFIINSVRAYEFWGYNWWLPLWDAEMMDFWARVPLELRRGEKFYIEYVAQTYARVAGLDNNTAVQSSHRTKTYKLKQIIKRTPLLPLARAIYEPIKIRREYNNHPMAWYGIMGDKVDFKIKNINSFLVKELLDNSQ